MLIFQSRYAQFTQATNVIGVQGVSAGEMVVGLVLLDLGQLDVGSVHFDR